jgi:hypothetical protein
LSNGIARSARERVKVTAQLCEVPAIVAKADEPVGAHRQDRHPVNAKLIGHSGVNPTDPLVRGLGAESDDSTDHRRSDVDQR